MDALLQTVTQTVRQDMHDLVATATEEASQLTELEPPNYMHWGFPLGFASIAAAGALLVAAGGVQTRVHDRIHHTRKAKHVRRPLRPQPQSTPWQGRAAPAS